MACFHVTTCNNLIDAHMIKHMLENENIPCFLHNEQTANLIPGNVYQVGIKVMVHEQNAEKALRLLNQYDEKKALVCPCCSSANVMVDFGSNWFVKIIYIFISVILALPSGKLKSRYTCKNCGSYFRT